MGSDTERPEALVVRANKLDILERLADDLAHEIKNPLHSMVINLEVLKRRVARWNTDEQGEAERYIGVLGAELERVTRRIELLLRLSRPARRAEPVTLDELVHELKELIELEGRRHEVSVRIEPAGLPAPVNVPREQVRQVILDMVLEVLDGSAPGGALVIRTARLDDRAAVSVSALDGDGRPLPLADDASAPSGGTVARLPAARAIAGLVGGTLELDGALPSPHDGGTGGGGVVFTIPVAGA
ncbi:MAG TPA: histidine kinase dimerization/phospho-acceptor domain-containing protein [Longimicrobiaceae bacterium]|nr:histidine kinase dimerization/phospho-acceptor domain-containing protein [Longimicrobiaceae bacterium]